MRKILISLLIIALGVTVFVFLTQKKKVDLNTVTIVNYDLNEDPNINRGVINDKWGLTDKEGNVLLDFEYEFIDTFANNGLAIIKKEGKYGFINKKFKTVLPTQYDYAAPFIYGMSIVTAENGKKGVIDIDGNFIVKPTYYDYISNYSANGNARAENLKDKKVVLINKYGQIVKRIK